MRAIILPAFAAALGLGLFSAPQAEARFNASQLQAPSLVEDAQCVTRRIRTVRPNGRVVYRTVRRCGPRYAPRRPYYRPYAGRVRERCRLVQERIYNRNGTITYRNVRRCR